MGDKLKCRSNWAKPDYSDKTPVLRSCNWAKPDYSNKTRCRGRAIGQKPGYSKNEPKIREAHRLSKRSIPRLPDSALRGLVTSLVNAIVAIFVWNFFTLPDYNRD
jgi:hypothetical protein